MNLLKKIFGLKTKNPENQKPMEEETREMIKGVVELSDTAVKDVIVPRTDVVFIPFDVKEDELMEIISNTGHSRFPVYKETFDEVVGILYVKELLLYMHRLRDLSKMDIMKVVRKPYFIPESKKLDSLLKEFKRLHVHIAVAVDEYGGVSGIVCMEDIIEEIVGDIQDEFDNESEDIIKLGENTWLCDARTDIEDLNDQLEIDLPHEEFDTLGGFVFDLFGKIPVKFEKRRAHNVDFIVQVVDGHRIRKVKLVVHHEDE